MVCCQYSLKKIIRILKFHIINYNIVVDRTLINIHKLKLLFISISCIPFHVQNTNQSSFFLFNIVKQYIPTWYTAFYKYLCLSLKLIDIIYWTTDSRCLSFLEKSMNGGNESYSTQKSKPLSEIPVKHYKNIIKWIIEKQGSSLQRPFIKNLYGLIFWNCVSSSLLWAWCTTR